MSKKDQQSMSQALWESIVKTAKHFNARTAPKPEDSIFIKLGKYLGRLLGIILSIALSPLVLLALFLAFVAAL